MAWNVPFMSMSLSKCSPPWPASVLRMGVPSSQWRVCDTPSGFPGLTECDVQGPAFQTYTKQLQLFTAPTAPNKTAERRVTTTNKTNTAQLPGTVQRVISHRLLQKPPVPTAPSALRLVGSSSPLEPPQSPSRLLCEICPSHQQPVHAMRVALRATLRSHSKFVSLNTWVKAFLWSTLVWFSQAPLVCSALQTRLFLRVVLTKEPSSALLDRQKNAHGYFSSGVNHFLPSSIEWA